MMNFKKYMLEVTRQDILGNKEPIEPEESWVDRINREADETRQEQESEKLKNDFLKRTQEELKSKRNAESKVTATKDSMRANAKSANISASAGRMFSDISPGNHTDIPEQIKDIEKNNKIYDANSTLDAAIVVPLGGYYRKRSEPGRVYRNKI